MFLPYEPVFTAIIFAVLVLWKLGVLSAVGSFIKFTWRHAWTKQDTLGRVLLVAGFLMVLHIWGRHINQRLENFSEFLHWWFQATKEYRLKELQEELGQVPRQGR